MKEATRATSTGPPARASLDVYRRKRDFTRTPEPAGSRGRPIPERIFVIQRHAARRLHYDFRLELGGVLKSWAVPKGPGVRGERRLAVQVEDHPLDYAAFEGRISEGEYGAGTVKVWDHGTWIPEGDPEQGYTRGKLSFSLNGKRLRGKWTLVRTGGRAAREGKENWLLIMSRDGGAAPSSAPRTRKPRRPRSR